MIAWETDLIGSTEDGFLEDADSSPHGGIS